MKRIGIIEYVLLVAVGMCCGQATAQTRVFSKVVGITQAEKVPNSGLSYLGCNFDTQRFQDLTVISQFRAGARRIWKTSDRVILMDTSGDYIEYLLRRTSAGAEWRWLQNVKAQGSVDIPLSAGEGFIVRSSRKQTAGVELITLSGAVVLDETKTVEIQEGNQLLSYPFSCERDLNLLELSKNATGAPDSASADQIFLWNAEIQEYTSYGLFDNGSIREWRLVSAFDQPQEEWVPISLGEGFLYRAKKPFTWTESNPYLDNL